MELCVCLQGEPGHRGPDGLPGKPGPDVSHVINIDFLFLKINNYSVTTLMFF